MSNNYNSARRHLLKGITLGGALLASGGTAKEAQKDQPSKNNTTDFPKHFYEIVPSLGWHQAGIINPEPKEATFIAFKVMMKDPVALQSLLRSLSARILYLTQPQDIAVDKNDQFPPKESGLLGGTLLPDQLTITLSVGSTLFDERFGISSLKPKHLVAMTSFQNDRLEENWCGGDIALQLCANSKEIIIYALRDIMKHHYKEMAPIWKMDGFLPARDIETKSTPINLFGFKDGTGNADTSDVKLMDDLVWVSQNSNEPNWALGGSYQALRLIRFNLEFWDRTPLEDQENDFGRIKRSGAPMGKTAEHDDPDFKNDPHGDRVLFDSHMRRAEPRIPTRHVSSLHRRSYSYSLGLTSSGLLDMGLIFVCYQNDLQKGFINTQRRLNGEPLERYIKPFGGGYFFALPGMQDSTHYLGEGLFL